MCQEKFWLPRWLRLQEPWRTYGYSHTSVSGQCLLLGCLVLRSELAIVILGSSGTGVGLLPYGQSRGLDTPVPFGHCVRVWQTVWPIVPCSLRYGHV